MYGLAILNTDCAPYYFGIKFNEKQTQTYTKSITPYTNTKIHTCTNTKTHTYTHTMYEPYIQESRHDTLNTNFHTHQVDENLYIVKAPVKQHKYIVVCCCVFCASVLCFMFVMHVVCVV